MNDNLSSIHLLGINPFYGSSEPNEKKSSKFSSRSWTQEKDLELIKNVSMTSSWKKLLENIFPEYNVNELRHHYWTLFLQQESNENLKKQFVEYPPPSYLKVDKTAIRCLEKKSKIQSKQKWTEEMNLNLIECVAILGSWRDIQKNVFPQFKPIELYRRYHLLLRHSPSDTTLANQFIVYPPPSHLKFPADIVESGIIQKYYAFSLSGPSAPEDLRQLVSADLNLKKFWNLEKDLALIKYMSEENTLKQIKSKLSFPGTAANLNGHYKALIKRKFQNSVLAQQFDKYLPHRSKPSLCKYLENALSVHLSKVMKPSQDFTEEEKIDIEKIEQDLIADAHLPMEQIESDTQDAFLTEMDLEVMDQLFEENSND